MTIETNESTILVTIVDIDNEKLSITYDGSDEIYTDTYSDIESFQKQLALIEKLKKEKVSELKKIYDNFDEIPFNEKMIKIEITQNS